MFYSFVLNFIMKGVCMKKLNFKILFLTSFLSLINIYISAQTISWSSELKEEYTRGSNYIRRSFISSDKWDNCYSIYQTSNVSNNSDITITKFGNGTSSGWTRTYNTPENFYDFPLGIETSNTGESYILGNTYLSTFESRTIVLKYDISGNLLWTFSIDSANTEMNGILLKRDNAGNILVLSNRAKHINGITFIDFQLIKLSQDGNFLWSKVFDLNQTDVPRDLYLDNYNNIIISGYTYAVNGVAEWLTVMYSYDGNFLWSHVHTTNSVSQPGRTSVTGDAAGNLYVTGVSYTGSNSPVLRLDKFSSNGTLLWVYYHNTVSTGTCITKDKFGNILVGGTEKNVSGTGDDMAVFKFNSVNGTLLGIGSIIGTGNNNDYLSDIKSDTSGNIYLLGNYYSEPYSGDMKLCKMNNLLKQKWQVTYNGNASGNDVSLNMAFKNDGTIFFTGDCNIFSQKIKNGVLKITDLGSTAFTSSLNENLTVPHKFLLNQNYPNPFNPSTIINFILPQSSNVELKVYDLNGKQLEILLNEYRPAGNYSIPFNAGKYPSGVYFYTINTGNFSDTKKMILIK